MSRKRSTLKLKLAVVATIAMITAFATAQTELVLYSFQNNNRDGSDPDTGVIFDTAGNLYGTTDDGGSNHDCVPEAGCGTVFMLTKNANGSWTQETLHEFGDNNKDGSFPEGGLTFDAAGNLYGTTVQGGSYGLGGTAFELSPVAGGGWTEKILHSFGKTPDGDGPEGGLVIDSAGNLYGTTFGGGSWLIDTNGGTVFELSPKAGGGGWSEKILHHFGTDAKDGFGPTGRLTLDAEGNLYGTTVATNEPGYCPFKNNCGVVFELSPQTDGSWTETILHTFQNNGTDGEEPYSGVVFDAHGNLYGTTTYGGHTDCQGYSCGTVFELSPQADGSWKETILHAFDDNGTDGYNPSRGNLALDSAGNLYGTTYQGGAGQSGILYKLAPQSDGSWTETIVHEFGQVGYFAQGFGAAGTLMLDASGNIYGTAGGGGFNECIEGCGLVFEITP